VTNGYRPWDRIAILSQRSAQRRWYHRLGMLRQTVVPIAWPIGTQQRELEQERPAFIEGYPSRLHLVADGLSLGYRPKAVLSHSETLAPIVRERLEQAFGISVSNIYESWECGRIAWEFPGSQGLVLGMDSHIVEVLDGEVCVTDLHNYAMPLIRYRTGDQARLSDSGGLRRLDSIDGRISDYLDLPDGTRTPLLVVFHALIRAPGIGGFQLRRRSRQAVTVLIQVAGGYSSRTDQEIRNTLMQRFGFIDVQIEPVEALPRTESGKLRWLVDETQMQKTLLT
jgi:phenylacetate-CoA ligase